MPDPATAVATANSGVEAIPPIKSAFDYFVVHVLSNTALVIAFFILVVGIVALILQFRLFKAGSVRTDEILRISAVTLIITFSLSLAAFLDGEDLKAAAPIFGLFSTIAGYLLGSAQRGVGLDASPNPTRQETHDETTRP